MINKIPAKLIQPTAPALGSLPDMSGLLSLGTVGCPRYVSKIVRRKGVIVRTA